MKKIDKYDNDTAAELLAHPNEYTPEELVYSRYMLQVGWDMQRQAGVPRDERIMSIDDINALDAAVQERIAIAAGDAAADAINNYNAGYNLYHAITGSDKDIDLGISTKDERLLLDKIRDIIAPLDKLSNELGKLGKTLQELRDRVQAVAVVSTSNAWRLAYIAQTILLNEMLKEQGGTPSDENMTLDGLKKEDLDGIVQTIPDIENGMYSAGAFNNLLLFLASRFHMEAFTALTSEYLGKDASFPVLAETSHDLVKVIRTKLEKQYVGVEKASIQDRLEEDLDTFTPLLAMGTVPERPMIWQEDLDKAHALIDDATTENISDRANEAYNLMFNAMLRFDIRDAKAGGTPNAEKDR